MKAKRIYKDSLFRDIFNDRRRLQRIYKALTGRLVTLKDIKITTLRGTFFEDIKNDVSFMAGSHHIVLMEHQSTLSENIPLRMLWYIAKLYRQKVNPDAPYKKARVPLPVPHFFMFYNGTTAAPEKWMMRLSDAFEENEHTLELVVTAYNINYEENKELYDSLKITRNAWQLFSGWNFYDPEVFPLDAQKKILDAQKHKELNMELVRGFFDKYPYKWFENPMFYCFLVMAALVIVFGKRKWQVFVTVVMELAAITAVFFIMYWNGRYNLERVDSPIWLCACLIFAFFLDRDRFVVDGRCAAVLILVVLALNQNTWSKSWRHNTKKKENKMTRDANLVAQTSRDSEHLYLSKVGLYTLSTAYSPLSLVPIGAGANTCALGGWPAGSPSYTAVLKQYGVENPYRDSINNDKVYWIDNHIDWTISYLHEYYDDQVQAKQIGTFDEKYAMYQLVSGKKEQN